MTQTVDLSGIGFGCGRLRGGLEARASVRLIEAALQLGIRHFDVAPGYGEGAAESLLGSVVHGLRSEVQLVSKFGLPLQAPGAVNQGLRAIARQLAKPVLGRWIARRALASHPEPALARAHGRFSPKEMSEQLARTLQALRTDYLDAWLLHEPSMSDPSDELERELHAQSQSGRVRMLGVGTGGPYAWLPAFGAVAQCRVGRDLLNAPGGQTIIVHGLLRFRAREPAPLESQLLQRLTGGSVRSTGQRGEVLQAALLAAALLQRKTVSKVLVSTSSPARLQSFVQSYAGLAPMLTGRAGTELDAFIAAGLARYDGMPG